MRRIRVTVTAFLLLGGCGSDKPVAEPAPPATSQPTPARTGFEVVEAESVWATATPKSDGYALKSSDGTPLGKISFGADRVKVKGPSGATTAKVKHKDYGFKIYKDDDTAVIKVKRKGAGYKLKRDNDTELGELSTKGPGGTLSSEAITVTSEGGRWIVKRGGVQVGAVDQSIPGKAVSFLGVTELSIQQRVAAMLYVQEHES